MHSVRFLFTKFTFLFTIQSLRTERYQSNFAESIRNDMKNKRNVLYILIIMLAGVIHFPVQAQQKNGAQDSVEIKELSTSHRPNSMVRAIKQDRKGNIWLASSEGIIRYDGKSFTNITSKVMSARFFSVLEDRKGNFWFATIGSGVYYYNGKSFQNYTTKDGLSSD